MKANRIYLCLFLLSTFISSGQQNQAFIDSLKQELTHGGHNDSIKVVLLTKLHEKLMFAEPEVAKGYAQQELNIYKETGLELAYGLGNLHMGDYHFNKSENDSALYYYTIAKTNFEKNNKTRAIIFVNYTLADIYKMQGDYKKALSIFENSIDQIEKHISDEPYKSQFLASSYLAIGSCYFAKGDLRIALSETLRALKLYETINDALRSADTFKQLGDIESRLLHYKNALTYYQEAQKIYHNKNDNIYEANALHAIGQMHTHLNQPEEAETYLLKSIALAKKYEVKATQAKTLNELGLLYISKKEHQKAIQVLTESEQIASAEGIVLQQITTGKSMALLAENQGNYNKALRMLNKSISLCSIHETQSLLGDLFEQKAHVLEKQGNYKASIANYKNAQAVHDSISSVEKTRQIEELKTIYETEKKEAEIALQKEEINTLNEKAKVDRLTKSLYAGGMFTFVSVSGLLFFGFRQRIKKNRIAREKKEALLQKEIDHKKKELASQTLHLVQKNTFIQELKENLENLKNSPEKFKMEFRRIVMLLKKENASDRDWEVFKSYFSEVHNDFDQKIKTLCPDITEKEIRLSAFLRMNLSTKEIAATLNVLPDSILKSKYRLKKKLGLDKDQDLGQFLNAF
ncbi:tetratricopeptide repeat protein [Sediminicola luteus]|uniref:Uncharacterized protein n=1 Tax=Sediminicola luteus TaxID=319238 RepID=A0A2A4G7S5_9FLAO|nr:tetratricopeptide repeat protein [Sediminicola luteus]PCE63805.1 hypothetical protein B7P33_11080 [Sediminicola luteus]